MKLIKLTQGKFAKVDDQDYEWINSYKWYTNKRSDGKYYAFRKSLKKEINYKYKTTISMHRMITSCPNGYDNDHINGDGLDNRRHNLRICSHKQNQYNKRMQKNNTSGYKGVRHRKENGHWYAVICINNKNVYLGTYLNKKDAAKAYNTTAIKYFGEFAKLNKI